MATEEARSRESFWLVVAVDSCITEAADLMTGLSTNRTEFTILGELLNGGCVINEIPQVPTDPVEFKD